MDMYIHSNLYKRLIELIALSLVWTQDWNYQIIDQRFNFKAFILV